MTDVTRRKLLGVLGLGALMTTSSGTALAQQAVNNEPFHGMAVVTGDADDLPTPGGPFFKSDTHEYAVYHFLHIDPRTGERHILETGDSEWTEVPTHLVNYAETNLPDDAGTGNLYFDTERRVPAWFDGNNYEWPTFVDNNDVRTSSTTVTNTTMETEIYRFSADSTAIDIQGRLQLLRAFGRYTTASSSDGFTFRVYLGDNDFNPPGEGQLVVEVPTVMQNVNNGPWHSKTTITVYSPGVNGSAAVYQEGAFNNNKADGVPSNSPVTLDTTTAEDFVATIQWSAAKEGNVASIEQAYLQQSA